MGLKLIGIGDNVVDKYLHLGQMFPGGQALNFAVFAKKMGETSAYMGVFGDDKAAGHIISALGEIGVDLSRCRHVRGENGYAKVDLIDGDRKFIGSNKGGVSREFPLRLDEEDLNYIKGFDLIHTSNNSFIDPELPKLASCGVPVSYDFSNTFGEERLDAVCPYIRFAFLSCAGMTKSDIEALLKTVYQKGCDNVVATMGAEGSVYYDGLRFYRFPSIPTIPVDTLGAGDAFATGCLVSIMRYAKKRGWDDLSSRRFLPAGLTSESLHVGAQMAKKACSNYGAFGYGIEIE